MLLEIETSECEICAEDAQNNLICDVMASRPHGVSSLTLQEREALRLLRRTPQAPSAGLQALFALSETPLDLVAER